MINKGHQYIFSLFFLSLIILFNIINIYVYAIDFPYLDEWDLFPKGNFRQIFSFHNENMQVFYNIISEIMYKLTDWNLRYFSFTSFFFYILVVVVYFYILKQCFDKPYFPILLLPILTPNLSFNWLWPLLMQTHNYIMFFLLAVYFGFLSSQKYSLHMFVLCIACSIISMNIPLGVALIIAYAIKEYINATNENKFQNTYNVLFSILTISSFIIILSFRDLHKDFSFKILSNVFSLEYIKQVSFYISNSFSSFGFVTHNDWYIYSFLIFLILAFLICFREQYKEKKKQALFAIIFCVIFNMMIVISFRIYDVYNYDGSFIRHNEVMFIAIPAILAILLQSKIKIIKIYGVLLLFLLITGVAKQIIENRFKHWNELLYKGQEQCIIQYQNRVNKDWICTPSHPHPTINKIVSAHILGLSFTKGHNKYSVSYN